VPGCQGLKGNVGLKVSGKGALTGGIGKLKGYKIMNVLLACEESQTVCKEFRRLGVDAYSCDILPCSGGHPEWHIQGDVIDFLNNPPGYWESVKWDIIIAFPPCTDLCSSGARWFKEKRADGRQQASIDFFMSFVGRAPRVAIENPIGIMSTQYCKPSQIIQPWQFGCGETKATCLWLENLPLLKPTDIVNGREQRIHKLAPSINRSKERSKTYKGIATAMATQWSIIK